MKNKKFWIIFLTGIILIGIAVGIYFYLQKDDFSVNPIYPIKANIQVGGEFSSTIKITNNENKEQRFDIYFNEFNELFSLSEDKFTLGAKESKEIKIYFNDKKQKTEFYSGNLIIKSNSLEQKIPFLITVKNTSPVFAILYEPVSQYENIYPGGVFGINLKVFDIQENYKKEAQISYLIRSLNGKIIYNEKNKSLIVDGKYSSLENFNINKNAPLGNYVLITKIDYKGTKSISGYLFKISKKKSNFFLHNLSPFMMLILVFFIGVLFLFVYFLKTRNDFLIKLKSQQNKELESNLKLINYSKKSFNKKFPKKKGKEDYLENIKNKIIGKIKKKHKKQVVQLKKSKKRSKKLKGQKKKLMIKKQLNLWKQQGYKMLEAKNEMKKIPKSKQMFNWKKQGYKI